MPQVAHNSLLVLKNKTIKLWALDISIQYSMSIIPILEFYTENIFDERTSVQPLILFDGTLAKYFYNQHQEPPNLKNAQIIVKSIFYTDRPYFKPLTITNIKAIKLQETK